MKHFKDSILFSLLRFLDFYSKNKRIKNNDRIEIQKSIKLMDVYVNLGYSCKLVGKHVSI